jgi:hypothetical protein
LDSGKGTKTTALEISLLSATMIYEAAKTIKAPVYIMMWGNNEPIVLAKPGDSAEEIGRNIQSVRSGLNSGTDFAPSIKKMSTVLGGDKKRRAEYSGFTHAVVFSDGDIYDQDKAKKVVGTLMQFAKYVTLDFAIVESSYGYMGMGQHTGQSNMEKLAREMKNLNPSQKIGVASSRNVAEIPIKVMELLLEKMRYCNSFTAVPREKKRKSFQRAGTQMDVSKPSPMDYG